MSGSFNPGLKKGQIINNTELMEFFKVSNSGGMRRSHRTNSLVLVTDHTKNLYGDRWEGDVLHYTGMGLTGDQELEYMQNKTLSESNSIMVNLFLLEVFEPRKYTYMGQVKLIGTPYQEDQSDINGNIRKVWIFPLKLIEGRSISADKYLSTWTCPLNSCNHKKIVIDRNHGIIKTNTWEEIIIHFLQHFSKNIVYFGPSNIEEFLEEGLDDLLSDADRQLYEYEHSVEEYWRNRIRTALGPLKSQKQYINTDKSSNDPSFRPHFQTRRRTDKFFGNLKIYSDWPKESEIRYPLRKKLDKDLLDHEEIENVKDLLLTSKQIILFGPPGTGKTYFAQVLAQEIAENHYEIIQFHPSYSYEDFVEWIETVPTDDGKGINFEPKPRIFRRLCKEASNQPSKNFVLIIDEINRGDLGRIFGELILGLEPSNRNLEINTPLSKSLGKLRIPENLYIIGTMNSVDRSIAIVDYALRRRFLFYLMMPNFKILEKWVNIEELNFTDDLKSKFLNLFTNLNNKIKEDRKLSRHHQIGHTYFFVKSEKELKIRWAHMIKPLIDEYYNFNEDDLTNYKYEELIQG